tara:strand:+ start:467 stop:1603 length:1137 start_codon:yes stop_codon:yes gene_type:complete
MALNVVPLLFVALPFVLAMDAMYDLAQDFMVPEDRRGWGLLSDENVKTNRVNRAIMNHTGTLLQLHQAQWNKWLKGDEGKRWLAADNEERKRLVDSLAKRGNKEDQDKLNRINGTLRRRYGWGVAGFTDRKEDGPPSLKGAKLELGLNDITGKNLREINQNIRDLKNVTKEHKNKTGEKAHILGNDQLVNAFASYSEAAKALEKAPVNSGAHSGIFKWVVYNQKPEKGPLNMFAWNLPTLLVAGVVLNMLGEYYSKFNPVLSSSEARQLCDIIDTVLLVHIVIVGVQLLVSLYHNFDSINDPNSRNPSLDLTDLLDHPEDFVSSVIIGLYNHLGTAVLMHSFVRALLGNPLNKRSMNLPDAMRRSSRRSRRSSRRRRR